MTWVAGATFVNPTAGTVLADTGPLGKGYYTVQIAVSANTGLEVLLQYRDADNLVTLKQKTVPVTLSSTFEVFPFMMFVETNERFRVVQRNDVSTGEVEVSIVYFLSASGGEQSFRPP